MKATDNLLILPKILPFINWYLQNWSSSNDYSVSNNNNTYTKSKKISVWYGDDGKFVVVWCPSSLYPKPSSFLAKLPLFIFLSIVYQAFLGDEHEDRSRRTEDATLLSLWVTISCFFPWMPLHLSHVKSTLYHPYMNYLQSVRPMANELYLFSCQSLDQI